MRAATRGRTIRWLLCGAALSFGLVVTVDKSVSAPAGDVNVSPSAYDPSTWSDEQLAAQLVLAGLQPSQLDQARVWASAGVGGFILYGDRPVTLRTKLARIVASGGSVGPFISSDEEGGGVQRLKSLLGPLPSAATMGRTSTPTQVSAIAHSYGTKMRRLGVTVDLAPVADLKVRGKFIARAGRAFSHDPATVGSYVSAWDAGMRRANVATVVKHWPGHGSAADTHIGSSTTPNWRTVQSRDLVPFLTAFANGARAVMVGHLSVPGLTKTGLAASMSPVALATLRSETGPDVVIMTDSVTMPAVTSAMRQSVKAAAVRALRAGSDIAMVNGVDPMLIAAAIAEALRNGSLPRAQIVASVNRVLALKQQLGLLSLDAPIGSR